MEFTATDVEGIKAEAALKGMMAIDQNTAEGLLEEYEEKLAEAADLCNIVDPVEKPYDSKYKGRKVLDDLLNKLEATKTVSMMEGRRETVAEMNWRIAACQVKQGVISWEVEEPHNAQDELERAASFYSPDFVQEINDMVGVDHEGEEEEVDKGSDSATSSTSGRVSLDEPPEVKLPKDNLIICIDAMQCLNMLGILWAGRGVVKKSFLYLLAANNLYERSKKHTMKLNASSSASNRRKAKELESVYTHNLFYLAQAYGHIGNATKSGEYCYMTLQRQLMTRFDSISAALDWVKNCVGISDFYIALGHYKRCALALTSAEVVLMRQVLEPPADGPNSGSESQADIDAKVLAIEVHADLNRRIAHLDMLILKRAFDRRLFKDSCTEGGIDFYEPVDDDEEDKDNGTCAKATSNVSNSESNSVEYDFFSGLSVPGIPYLCAGDIDTFQVARAVFLRASVRIDAAKKFYIMDGYVSDHVNILQEQSKIYHYLAVFDEEPKRRMGMENKRIEILSPLLSKLNPVAFEGLHKELAYELGETYMTLHDIKIEKLRLRRPDGNVNGDVIKKSELENCNILCHKSIAMFTHYLSFFAPASDTTARGVGDFINMPRDELVTIITMQPNLAAIAQEEARSYLNSHFLVCRMLSRLLIPPGSNAHERSKYIALCLKRYEWLVKFAPKFCEGKDLNINDIFDEEFSIIKDMAELLPVKINKIHHLGENPTI